MKEKLWLKVFMALLFASLMLPVAAQEAFSVDSTLKRINRTTDFGILHHYVALTNRTGEDLPMRWVRSYSADYDEKNWGTTAQDRDQFYEDLEVVDSAEFVLRQEPSNLDKIIIGVDHRGVPGTARISFRLFPVDQPDDAVTIIFVIGVQEAEPSAVLEPEERNLRPVYPNPVQSVLYMPDTRHGEWQLYDAAGQRVSAPVNDNGTMDVSALSEGLYVLRRKYHNTWYTERIEITRGNP